MTWETLLAFNLILGASILSPGPAFLLALRSTLTRGRAAGLQVGLGLGLMAAAWTAMALAGIDLVFQLFPWAYTVLKIGGAAYLIWIAWHMWRDAAKPLEMEGAAHAGILSGILVNLGNPKSVLFAASVLVAIFPSGLSFGDKALIVLNHFALEITFYACLAYGLSRPAVQNAYLGAKSVFDRIAAGLLGLLGVKLLLDR